MRTYVRPTTLLREADPLGTRGDCHGVENFLFQLNFGDLPLSFHELNQSFLSVAAADERWHRVAADADCRGTEQPERQRLELPPRVLALDVRLDPLRPEFAAADGTADDKHLAVVLEARVRVSPHEQMWKGRPLRVARLPAPQPQTQRPHEVAVVLLRSAAADEHERG